jgi:hypothetical protein
LRDATRTVDDCGLAFVTGSGGSPKGQTLANDLVTCMLTSNDCKTVCEGRR